MPVIFETTHFIVAGHDTPHHDRNNGGHAKVYPKQKFSNRSEMPLELYLTMMSLVLVAGEAITTVMRSKGVDVIRINYQDNGNWAHFNPTKREPQIHEHLYVRSKNEKHPAGDARFMAFPNALFFPFIDDHPDYYASFQPYSEQDCADIKVEILRLLSNEKYKSLQSQL